MMSSLTCGQAPSEEPIDLGSLLADPDLLRLQAYAAGRWTDSDSGVRVEVFDPGRGILLGSVPSLSEAQVRDCLEGAESAFQDWREWLPGERAVALQAWAALVEAHEQDLSVIMTHEQGKPLDECRGEIAYAASFLRWFAEEARRIRGEGTLSHLAGCQTFVSREPAGVAACITPWNFPSAMITRKAGAALAAGCSVLVKPAPETPFSALALAVLAERSGLPPGVLSVVTGDAAMIGGVIARSPLVRVLSFTGSTRVGRLLAEQSASTIKKLSMELGGHAPFLVFADADLDKAVRDAVTAKFQTTGQDCLAANRILVQEPIYDAFVDRFATLAGRLKLGLGTEPGVEIGPLINARAVARCLSQVEDAVGKGARLLVGGERHRLGPGFMLPTVLADCDSRMAIWRDETFGPVAALGSFSDEAQAIGLANDTEAGLAAYVYTENGGRALRISKALRFGMVAINTAKFTGAPIPFGGMKQSGLGREGSSYGIDDYTELKYRCFAT